MRIEERAAIVVGGASGLGEATARALAERGARVLIADRDEERGRALAGELGGLDPDEGFGALVAGLGSRRGCR